MNKVPITDIIKGWANTDAELTQHSLFEGNEYHSDSAYRGYVKGFQNGVESQLTNQGLTLNDYQDLAMKTCMKSCDNFGYMMLNLVGELGELASKIAKDIRKGQIEIDSRYGSSCTLIPYMNEDEWAKRYEEYELEAGDILWQLSGFCKVMGWTLEEVGQKNLEKLASRAKRGKIDGDGDYR